jgi:thiosulfate dehydrogenase
MLLMSVIMNANAKESPHAHEVVEPIQVSSYKPPAESDIPDNEFGNMVKMGKEVFVNTRLKASKYVGNGLNCANCHLNAGRLANSAPLWAAWVKYPAYRGKNKMVNTMEQRIQGCFRYSMNGTPPPADSDVLKSLMSYSFWLASGAPTNVNLPGRGYPKIVKPAKQPDFNRGKLVFEKNCAVCHGVNGHGTKVKNSYAFPPLWGKDSFNWGAGMHRINTAASFIHANMPLGKGGSLSVQDAWDVAYFMNSHERPQDPRYKGNVNKTDERFHSHQCRYGDKLGTHILGAK